MIKNFKPEIKLFLIVAFIVVVSVAGILLLRELTPDEPSASTLQEVFSTQESCEQETGRKCAFFMCDFVPEGMTFEEVCGGVGKGWQPTEETLEADTSGWQTYRNEEYGFEVKYPIFFKVAEQTGHLFKAGILLPYDQSYERLEIEVLEKPLTEIEYVASDGVVADSVYKFSARKNIWEYVSTAWGDLRPEDNESFRMYGRTPEKYILPGNTIAWVGKATNIHSTLGGTDWETAYIESPTGEFTIKVFLSRCRFAEGGKGCSSWSDDALLTNKETIFAVLATFRFVE